MFSSNYEIKQVSVNGLVYVSSDEFLNLMNQKLDQQKILFYKTKNIFLTSGNELRRLIDSNYIFGEVRIDKVPPDSLRFDINEKNVVFRPRSNHSERLIDDRGQVVRRFINYASRPKILTLGEGTDAATSQKTEELVSIDPNDQFIMNILEGANEPRLGEMIMDSSQVKFIDDVVSYKDNQVYKLKLLTLPGINPEYLKLKTASGFEIYFNTKLNFETQYEALKLVIEQKITPEKLPRLDYIDLRLGENVYYKFK